MLSDIDAEPCLCGWYWCFSCWLILSNLQKDEDTASSIWGEAPDKYGKWNCRCCFVKTGQFWRRWQYFYNCWPFDDQGPWRGPKVLVPRRLHQAKQSAQNAHRKFFICCNIIVRILNRVGTLGLTGKEARVEDEIYIVNVYLTKSGNLKVLIRFQPNQSNVIILGGAEAAAGRHEGKGCGENFSSSL